MSRTTQDLTRCYHDVVVIGGGAAGIAVSASLLKRCSDLDIAIIDPAEMHSYQPGWTLVGGGVFSAGITRRPMREVVPRKAVRYATHAQSVDPECGLVTLGDGRQIRYRRLVVAPGLVIDWGAIEGLEETLGENGVTSNYRYELAPYTWSLVQSLKHGKALFTQPPMPIKCAGAPQKAMYLSCDHWQRQGRLKNIDVSFCNAGQVLFGVPDYVPALEGYIEQYGIEKAFGRRLVAVDGPSRKARFMVSDDQGEYEEEREFDMLHVVPPQHAPAFIAESGLGNEGGWLDLNAETLQHACYPDVFGLGDASGTPNAKTAAAVRKQAPVVADNLLASLEERPMSAAYQGYGSCPLTVSRGRIVLAEFGYGGALQPTFPRWVNDGTQATRRAWWLKAKQLPWLYWHGMLKGREWMAHPARRDQQAEPVQAQTARSR
ncbi:NAD(P)/FAD-dependent oxidoreductase [Halomonas sp. 18H]|uniref:NAD(P)/FAD-dependent oxidoreductase n=1 Tax=Halomonas almeriensis TaxID=308163 RepID=UPI0022314231|nr:MULTISPECIES: FAD/NAD(P)-binding oxidoreductase [Halomonas]MCW4152740.1 NAD(P)/FAD-dependent oxidoreductase [Halomonas sp. 18H]MDN3552055.1 FAD/NAD(P)-binding oxidoreductase [Halomonas almeriensis]